MNNPNDQDVIKVYDLSGEMVISNVVAGTLTQLSLQSLPTGMYIVRVGTRTGKFLKE